MSSEAYTCQAIFASRSPSHRLVFHIEKIFVPVWVSMEKSYCRTGQESVLWGKT